jgi:hypothetical protein
MTARKPKPVEIIRQTSHALNLQRDVREAMEDGLSVVAIVPRKLVEVAPQVTTVQEYLIIYTRGAR